MNRPIARDVVDIYVPSGKIDDPKMKVTEGVQIEEGSYVLADTDPAIEDIRRVTMINGIVKPITLEDGTVLDGKTPYNLEEALAHGPRDP